MTDPGSDPLDDAYLETLSALQGMVSSGAPPGTETGDVQGAASGFGPRVGGGVESVDTPSVVAGFEGGGQFLTRPPTPRTGIPAALR